MTVLGHEAGGEVTIASSALQYIVVQAAESVDAARIRRARRRLEIEVDGGHARVELELSVRYGAVLAEVGREVQERVADALRTMLGVDVSAVDVSIEELET